VADTDKDKSSQDIMSSNANEDAAQQSAPEPKSNPSSGLAGPAYGEYAADAAAHLERSGGPFEGLGGDSQEIDRQAGSLMVWAREKNLILTEEQAGTDFDSHRAI